MHSIKFRFKVYFALFFLSLLTYYTSLHVPFLMDDLSLIVFNNAKTDLGFLQLDFFSQNENIHSGKNYLYFRPLLHIFITIPYLIFGLSPFGFHVFNLILFLISVYALYFLLVKLFDDQGFAFIASCLFCTHPINGVFVNYSMMTGYLVLNIAMIVALVLALKKEETGQLRYLLASLLAFVVALLGHEVAMALPLYLVAIFYIVKKLSIKQIIIKSWSYFFVLTAFMVFRMFYASLKTGVLDHIQYYDISILQYLATLYKLILSYIVNLVTLQNIVMIWSAPIVNSNIIFYSVLFLMLLLLSCSIVIQRRNEKFSLFVAFCLIAFAPLSLACFSRPNLGFIISPHWLVFVSIGYVCIVTYYIQKIFNSKKTIKYIIILVLMGGYVSASYKYNALWANDKKYINYMLTLSPKMHWPIMCLADIYMREKNYAKASLLYKRGLKLNRGDWDGYTNLGLAQDLLGNKEQAKQNYLKAIELNDMASTAYNNLATLYVEDKEWDFAEQYFLKAIKSDPYLKDAKRNLKHVQSQKK